MLWFKKQADPKEVAERDIIRPGDLTIALDEAIFGAKLDQMLTAMAEAGGVERFIDSLAKKHELFNQALAEDFVEALDGDGFAALLETVFTARRRISTRLEAIKPDELVAAVRHVVYGTAPIVERMEAFQDLISEDDRKARRAAWDLAAEMLHFNAPEHYPLMVRWVWDAKTQSGALREFIRGNDSMPDIPIGGEPEAFEAVRVWLVEQLNNRGFYRDLHFMIDLVLAQAYADYMIAMSNGMGMLGSDFGPKSDPLELVVKLLGIDPDRRGGRSRIKQPILH